MEKIIYLDNAATTQMFAEEFDLMKQNNDSLFFNPSASYLPARKTSSAFENARNEICGLLKGNNGKLYFTSSATESNNTIFEGVHLRKGDVVLVSAGEHPSVYESAHRLEKNGIIVKDIPLDKFGRVDEDAFCKLIDENVKLVSVIHISNETGVINDIKRLCSLAKKINPKVLFHSDGVQAFGKIKINLADAGVDFYTISAHKIYAPRGIAGLWIKNGAQVDSLLVGGGQENGFRSSTENVYGALCFAYAAKKVCADLEQNYEKVLLYKSKFLEQISRSKVGGYVSINSDAQASPYIVSVSVSGIKGEVLVNSLETDGVLISTGSACSSKKAGNRTLSAMGLSSEQIIGSVRISFSPYISYDFEKIGEIFERHILRFLKNINIRL